MMSRSAARNLAVLVASICAFGCASVDELDGLDGSGGSGSKGGLDGVGGGGSGGSENPGDGGTDGGDGGTGGAVGGDGGDGGGEERQIGRFRLRFTDYCAFAHPCAEIRVGWTRRMHVEITDLRGEPIDDLPITWWSSNPDVVSVTEDGLVKGTGVGSARIYAAAGDREASEFYVVIKAAVAKIVITPDASQVAVGESVTFQAVAWGHDDVGNLTDVIPDAEIVWTMANPALVEVDQEGNVTGTSGGATWIRAWSPDGIPGHEGHALLEVESDVPLPAGMKLQTMAVKADHGCGIAPGGQLHCWGRNDIGQLGRGYQDYREHEGHPVPAPIVSATPLTFVRHAGSSSGHCGIEASGQAWCWGNNFHGGLGLGPAFDGFVFEPEPIPDLRFTTISLGHGHGCGIDLSARAWCWGSNNDGQVGTGHAGRDFWERPENFVEESWHYSSPMPVVGDHEFKEIHAGFSTCALDTDGRTWCWGTDESGLLGRDRTARYSSEPIPVAGGLRFESLTMGGHHVCGLTADGEAWCWGWNLAGGLGAPDPKPNGQPFSSFIATEPLRVQGGHRFTSLVAFLFSTCGLDEDGIAWCWGNNEHGHTGTGRHAERSEVPEQVYGDHRFRSIHPGMCGITLDGEAHCWGDNMFGRLGIGYTERVSPVPWPVSQPEASDE